MCFLNKWINPQQFSEAHITIHIMLVGGRARIWAYADSRSFHVGDQYAVQSRAIFISCLIYCRYEAHLCKMLNNKIAVICRQCERCEKKGLEELQVMEMWVNTYKSTRAVLAHTKWLIHVNYYCHCYYCYVTVVIFIIFNESYVNHTLIKCSHLDWSGQSWFHELDGSYALDRMWAGGDRRGHTWDEKSPINMEGEVKNVCSLFFRQHGDQYVWCKRGVWVTRESKD